MANALSSPKYCCDDSWPTYALRKQPIFAQFSWSRALLPSQLRRRVLPVAPEVLSRAPVVAPEGGAGQVVLRVVHEAVRGAAGRQVVDVLRHQRRVEQRGLDAEQHGEEPWGGGREGRIGLWGWSLGLRSEKKCDN